MMSHDFLTFSYLMFLAMLSAPASIFVILWLTHLFGKKKLYVE
jgi:hypothetical protein